MRFIDLAFLMAGHFQACYLRYIQVSIFSGQELEIKGIQDITLSSTLSSTSVSTELRSS